MKITLGDLNYIAKRIQNAVYETAVKSNSEIIPPLTLGESSVMGYLVVQSEPKSMREIVNATGLVQSWISTTVKNLERRNWVELGKDPKDKRVTTVRVKEELILDASVTVGRDAISALNSLLEQATDEEMQMVKNGLEAIYEIIKRQDG